LVELIVIILSLLTKFISLSYLIFDNYSLELLLSCKDYQCYV